MKKYAFLVFHKEYESFLSGLRDVGVVHVDEKQEGILQDENLIADVLMLQKIQHTATSLKRRQLCQPIEGKSMGGSKVLEDFDQNVSQIEKLDQQVQVLEKEHRDLLPWGSFDMTSIKQLQDGKVNIQFFSCPSRKFNADWIDEFNAIVVSESGSQTYFVTVSFHLQQIVIEEADPFVLPKHSISEVEDMLSKIAREKKQLEKELDELTSLGLMGLDNLKDIVQERVDFSKVVLTGNKIADEKVRVLEGWIPVDKESDLISYLDAKGIYSECREAKYTEKVPILLKNNSFVKLFEVIGNLYSKPSYNELDLTPFLAPFYLLFFGFCFSDAGYGLLFLLIASFYKIKASKDLKPILSLIQLLGSSTILFGLLGGTFFGIELYKTGLPFYKNAGAWIKSNDFSIQDTMMYASIGIGAIQILFGMILKAINQTRQYGFKYAISTLAWVLGIVASGLSFYLSEIEIVNFANIPYLVIAVISIVGIFFFNTPGKNIFLNIGTGLWDTYNTVVGGIGDLLSYVRLFALGIASAILGNVFNNLGAGIIDSSASIAQQIPMYIGMLLVLIVGHALNIFMSGLGSMVHPLRLTFVEFYKNAGFQGGGKEYKPFSKQVK